MRLRTMRKPSYSHPASIAVFRPIGKANRHEGWREEYSNRGRKSPRDTSRRNCLSDRDPDPKAATIPSLPASSDAVQIRFPNLIVAFLNP